MQIVSGTVVSIEVLRTLILSVDGVIVAVPNKILADVIIINQSRAGSGETHLGARQLTQSFEAQYGALI